MAFKDKNGFGNLYCELVGGVDLSPPGLSLGLLTLLLKLLLASRHLDALAYFLYFNLHNLLILLLFSLPFLIAVTVATGPLIHD